MSQLCFIDSHCHLDDAVFTNQLTELLEVCAAKGVRGIIVPGITSQQWSEATIQSAVVSIFYAHGLHPYFIDRHQPEHLDRLAHCLERCRAVAVGEFGLDFQLDGFDRERQYFYFYRQLELAKQLQLPVILHVRKAHDQVLKALRCIQLPRAGAIHAYSGSEQQAYQYIDLGFKLGFGGAVTYPRATKLRRLVASLPIENILLETDAPAMRPVFIDHEQVNSPRYLPDIAQCIAHLRQIDLSELALATTGNAVALFQLANCGGNRW